jgi:transposase
MKIHALTAGPCRPFAFLLTGGQLADCIAADALLEQMPATSLLLADKGYDTDVASHKIENKGVAPNVPPKANRRGKNCFPPYLYRHRNVIARMFGRLKTFRRIATRYDRPAHNFLAAVCLAASISCWLGVPSLNRACWPSPIATLRSCGIHCKDPVKCIEAGCVAVESFSSGCCGGFFVVAGCYGWVGYRCPKGKPNRCDMDRPDYPQENLSNPADRLLSTIL